MIYAFVTLIAGCYAIKMDPLTESGNAVRQLIEQRSSVSVDQTADATRAGEISMAFDDEDEDIDVGIEE